MLNDWEFALEDNTSKDLFGNKFEEEICRSSNTKTKSKDLFKAIASSNQPFRVDPLPSSGGRESSNRGFTFSFKGLNFTRGKEFVSTTMTSSSRPSSGLPVSEVFLPRGSSVPVPTGRKAKVFSEKLGETVQRSRCTKYDFGLQDTVFGSTLSSQIPETSANVQGEVYVSGYRNPNNLFSRKERFKPEAIHQSEKLEPAYPLRTFQNGGIISFRRALERRAR